MSWVLRTLERKSEPCAKVAENSAGGRQHECKSSVTERLAHGRWGQWARKASQLPLVLCPLPHHLPIAHLEDATSPARASLRLRTVLLGAECWFVPTKARTAPPPSTLLPAFRALALATRGLDVGLCRRGAPPQLWLQL